MRRRGALRYAEGGRIYTPLANEADYYTYGTSGPEHLFFQPAPQPPSPGIAANEPASRSGGSSGQPGLEQHLQDLQARGVPIVQGSGSRIDPAGGSYYDGLPRGGDPTGRGSGVHPFERLSGAIDLGRRDVGITDPGAQVRDLMGNQYQFNNPLSGVPDQVTGMLPGGNYLDNLPDQIGFNNPFSVVGRAYTEPLQIVDPVNLRTPSSTGNIFMDALYNASPEELEYLYNMGYLREKPRVANAAEGGGIRGPGTGRSDDIDARLSDGEYVIDAETVALLGDGSTDAGVRRLDEMRVNLRKHKGRGLAKGRFSANAKRPEEYMRLAKGGRVKKPRVVEIKERGEMEVDRIKRKYPNLQKQLDILNPRRKDKPQFKAKGGSVRKSKSNAIKELKRLADKLESGVL